MIEKDGVWRMIRGRRVFIRKGQSLSEAMRESGKFNNSFSYKDVTKEWLENVGNEKGTRVNQDFFVDNKGNRYDSTNATLIFDHTKSEENIANWFAQIKQKNIKMLPRVVNPKEVKSADFIEETSNIIWEIKEPIGNTIDTTMLNQFKGQKEKAHNFIIDMHLSEMNDEKAINEVIKIYNSKRYDWVEEVVLLRNKKVIKVFKR